VERLHIARLACARAQFGPLFRKGTKLCIVLDPVFSYRDPAGQQHSVGVPLAIGSL